MSSRWTLAFLGLACAVGVGSIYYNQPLLVVMGHSFGADARAMSFVALATQIGYAIGILCFVPLGDIADRRTLMMRLFAGVSMALLLAAAARGVTWMIVASVLIGLLASVTHVALPMAPELVPESERGRAIGTVMIGLLLGILLARTVAGWVANLAGWRSVFIVAAVVNLAFVPAVARFMPRSGPGQALSYGEAMRSLWTLVRTQALLREAAVLGALTLASFSCFWTTLAFMLQSHFGLGPGVAGTFGLVGAAGALVAPMAGRMADARGPRAVATIAGGLLTMSYLWLWLAVKLPMSLGLHMVVLALGVIILDVGAQMMQVSNQTRIFGLGAHARSRLNTIYMTTYFAGGALGSALAGAAWSRWGWNGVCSLAVALIGLGGIWHALGIRAPNADRENTAPAVLEG